MSCPSFLPLEHLGTSWNQVEPGLWEIGTDTVSQPQSRSPKMLGRSRPSTKTLVKNFPYSKTEEPKNELKAPASPGTAVMYTGAAPGVQISLERKLVEGSLEV